jgi:hypothetical protein
VSGTRPPATVAVVLDLRAIRDEDLERTGAIEY